MARKYELVSSVYDKGRFTNERVVYVGSLSDIDRITCMYYDSKRLIEKSEHFDFDGANSLSIRYQATGSSRPFYIHTLFNQKEMREIIDSMHLDSFYIGGKKIFTEVVDTKNPFFAQMRSDFFDKLNSMGNRFIDEVMITGGNSNLKLLVKNYLAVSNSTIYSSEDLQNFNEIKASLNREFSRYINFRNYVVALKKYNNKNSFMTGSVSSKRKGLSIRDEAFKVKNPVINKGQPYSRVGEYLDTSYDKEEFLDVEEIVKSVGEGNDLKGYKGYVKK